MGESILTSLEWIHVSIGLSESGVDVSIDIWSGFSGSGVGLYVRISFSISGVDVSIGFSGSGVDRPACENRLL